MTGAKVRKHLLPSDLCPLTSDSLHHRVGLFDHAVETGLRRRLAAHDGGDDVALIAPDAHRVAARIAIPGQRALNLQDRRAEVRIVIGEPAQMGQGIGTEAIGLLSDYAFAQLKLHKLYAYVLDINPRARRSFEKAGFVLEGTLREDRWVEDRFVDVYLLGRIG